MLELLKVWVWWCCEQLSHFSPLPSHATPIILDSQSSLTDFPVWLYWSASQALFPTWCTTFKPEPYGPWSKGVHRIGNMVPLGTGPWFAPLLQSCCVFHGCSSCRCVYYKAGAAVHRLWRKGVKANILEMDHWLLGLNDVHSNTHHYHVTHVESCSNQKSVKQIEIWDSSK